MASLIIPAYVQNTMIGIGIYYVIKDFSLTRFKKDHPDILEIIHAFIDQYDYEVSSMNIAVVQNILKKILTRHLLDMTCECVAKNYIVKKEIKRLSRTALKHNAPVPYSIIPDIIEIPISDIIRIVRKNKDKLLFDIIL